MGWHITLIDNQPNITEQCAKELFESQLYKNQENGDIWWDVDDVIYEGKLTFNSDHMEWMDYLSTNKKILEILKKHKVKGDITFANLNGDGAPCFWGFRFDGLGGCVELNGKIDFQPGKKL